MFLSTTTTTQINILYNLTLREPTMSRFQSKTHSALNARLNQSAIQVHVGSRPSKSRPIAHFAAVVLIAGAALSAAPSAHASWLQDHLTGHSVPASNIENAEPVSVGVIRQVHRVEIEAPKKGFTAGNVVGAVGGGLLGHLMGGGRGKTLMTLVGAVAGGKVGGDIQRSHQHNPGLEIVVEIVNASGGPYSRGQTVVITQPADVPFYPNDVVYVTGNRFHAPRIESFQSNDNVQGPRPASQSNPGSYNQNEATVGSVNAQYGNRANQGSSNQGDTDAPSNLGVVYSNQAPAPRPKSP